MDMYTVIFHITVFVLLITVAGVITNHLISQKNKYEIILVFGFYIYGKFMRIYQQKTNGASAEFIGIH